VYRKARGDMIEVFKIVHRYYDHEGISQQLSLYLAPKGQQEAVQIAISLGFEKILFYCSHHV